MSYFSRLISVSCLHFVDSCSWSGFRYCSWSGFEFGLGWGWVLGLGFGLVLVLGLFLSFVLCLGLGFCRFLFWFNFSCSLDGGVR